MKLRLSWSKLSSWAFYNKQDAINAIFGFPNIATEAMEKGSQAHKHIEDNKLVLVNGLKGNGKWEYKDRVEICDWLDLSFVLDYWEDDTIIDYKTGSYNEMQLKVYAFLMALKGVTINQGYFVGVNWNGKQIKVKRMRRGRGKVVSMVDKIERLEFDIVTHREAYDFIMENATEIRNYLISMDYLKDC